MRLRKAGGIEVDPRRPDRRLRLGEALKAQGPIWLGLTERVRSIRRLSGLRRHPPHGRALGLCAVALFAAPAAGTVAGMALTYLAPPLLAMFGERSAPRRCRHHLGADGARVPADLAVLRRVARSGVSRCRLIALIYTAFTLDSAYQHVRGRGGSWKGRVQANVSGDAHDHAGRSALGQRPSRREFPRRLAAHSSRAIARRSWPSTDSSAPPTTSPIMPRCRRRRSSRCSTGWRRPCSGAATTIRWRVALRRAARRAPAVAASRPGSAHRVPARRHQAALPRLGRPDRLLPLSAMPVGRFVLDVHGESRATWPANDALCAALQIINHLQDCGKDFRALDRVYLPLDALCRLRRHRRSARRRARLAGVARLPSHELAGAPAICCATVAPFSASIEARGSRWRSR